MIQDKALLGLIFSRLPQGPFRRYLWESGNTPTTVDRSVHIKGPSTVDLFWIYRAGPHDAVPVRMCINWIYTEQTFGFWIQRPVRWDNRVEWNEHSFASELRALDQSRYQKDVSSALDRKASSVVKWLYAL